MTTLLKTEIGDAIYELEKWTTISFTVYIEKLSRWDRLLLFFDKCLKRK